MNPIDTTASFGYWIRRQRMAIDLTQAELARQVGCATVTVSKIERDERRPSRQMAKLLADHLAIPEDDHEQFLAVAMGDVAVDRMPLTDQPSEGSSDLIEPIPLSKRSMLPIPTTPFIGRTNELNQLTCNLEAPDCRLLSLVGPGGVGKTRLAIRLGEVFLEREDLFPDGVFFVALDGVDSPALVISSIASTLQFTFIEQHDQETLLLDSLANRQLLLILDNAEQILEVGLVDNILARSAHVKILVTSREALQLQQEWFVPVEGMLGVGHQAVADTELLEVDAVQLFDACARRARPNFELLSESEHVLKICQLVDGVPLAIELAAAWLRTLSCAQIVDELNRSIDILSTMHRNVPERHRNIRSVFEQSWAFLNENEQRVFRQLSIFVGSFSLEAAQQVADASLMMLAVLVEKSVLHLGQNGRYRIHSLLRQFGAEKLTEMPDERLEIQARHSDFFLNFLQSRNESITGQDQTAVLEEVETEFDNIRAAWGTAAKVENLKQLDVALPCLVRYLWTRGRFADGWQMLDEIVDNRKLQSIPDDELAMLSNLIAHKAHMMAAGGKEDIAIALIDDVAETARKLDSLPIQALCYNVAGMARWYKHDLGGAYKNLQSAYELYKSLGYTREMAQVALDLANAVKHHLGDMAAAGEIAKESLDLFRSADDLSKIADAQDTVAMFDLVAGNMNQCETNYKESYLLAQQVGDQFVIARSTGGLGLVAWEQKNWDLAAELLTERLRIFEQCGYQHEIPGSLHLLCGLYANAGRYYKGAELLSDYTDVWWPSHFTAQIHVGVGDYNEAMGYLPKETQSHLETVNTHFLGSDLIAWAMLLLGNCALVRYLSEKGDEPTNFTDEERLALAHEIFVFLCDYEQVRPFTSQRAGALLAELKEKYSDIKVQYSNRKIEELAQDVLTIQLG